MLTFKEFLIIKEQNTVGYHNDGPGSGFLPTGGSYLTTDQTGSEQNSSIAMLGHPVHLPGIDFDIPSVEKTSIIAFVERNKNPILVCLQDGTKLNFTWNEFKRIKGCEPEKGKQMVVVFQRHPNTSSNDMSKILSCKCY